MAPSDLPGSSHDKAVRLCRSAYVPDHAEAATDHLLTEVALEYELLDTGVFDQDRYWITEVWYAKVNPTDVLMTVRVTNVGPDADTVHVLPTVWFRNT